MPFGLSWWEVGLIWLVGGLVVALIMGRALRGTREE